MTKERLEQSIVGLVCPRCGTKVEVQKVDDQWWSVCPAEHRIIWGVTRQVFKLAGECLELCGPVSLVYKESPEDEIREKQQNLEKVCRILRWGKDNWPETGKCSEAYYLNPAKRANGRVYGASEYGFIKRLAYRAGCQRVATHNRHGWLSEPWVLTWYGDYEVNRMFERLLQEHYVTHGRPAPEIKRKTW
jgi:hypothetical protein